MERLIGEPWASDELYNSCFNGLHKPKLKFVDLFSGLGGFHRGLRNSGFECVFACEIEPELRRLYQLNYGIEPHPDITKVNEAEVPEHEVLCAGFPCQPFSLAGKKKGAECPSSGKLIDDVIRIARYHNPQVVLLENVPNILTIAEGQFWHYLKEQFNEIGYQLTYKIISPVEIGIPQNRKRVFVICYREGIDISKFEWPQFDASESYTLNSILDPRHPHKVLEEPKKQLLAKWQNLLDVTALKNVPCISLVAPEFGATYPVDFSALTLKEIKKYKGAYGVSLSDCKTWSEVTALMPGYARNNRSISKWLLKSVKYSRQFYQTHSDILDRWKANLPKEFNSWQILEWRGYRNQPDIYQHIVQFRASGIRVLQIDKAPSLVAMTPTQIPVIPNQNRYMSHIEAAKLQNLHTLQHLPPDRVKAFKALGNAVNAKLVQHIGNNIGPLLLV